MLSELMNGEWTNEWQIEWKNESMNEWINEVIVQWYKEGMNHSRNEIIANNVCFSATIVILHVWIDNQLINQSSNQINIESGINQGVGELWK